MRMDGKVRDLHVNLEKGRKGLTEKAYGVRQRERERESKQ